MPKPKRVVDLAPILSFRVDISYSAKKGRMQENSISSFAPTGLSRQPRSNDEFIRIIISLMEYPKTG